jgi:sugar phosphate isomerase/epimerase
VFPWLGQRRVRGSVTGMQLGLKVGPANWRQKLDNDLGIGCAEVFFDLARADAYPALFAWLRGHDVWAGLHVSTRLDGGVIPNLATADPEVCRSSVALLERSLDVAAEQGMRFVVFHPGSYRDVRIREGRVALVGKAVPKQEGRRQVIEETLRLAAYGRERGVELLAENLPAREFAAYDPEERAPAVDAEFVPYTVLRALGERGVGLCVDVGHLYAEAAAAGSGTDGLFFWVMAATRQLAPYARHLHVSTTAPPWNGTDSHNGFLEADYAQGALPTIEELVSWLQLFPRRDVCVIPEPGGGPEVHLANYARLCAQLRARLGDFQEQTP